MSQGKKTARNASKPAPEYSSAQSAAPETSKKDWVLTALIAIYVLLTALLIFNVPVGAAPDEAAHLDYIQALAKAHLPVFQTTPAPGYGYEFHQPPLYYLLCVPFWKIGGAYACRLVSLLCGALTLVLLWHSIAHFFRGHDLRRSLQVLAVGLCALWPLHQGVGASASNDALAGLLAAGVFYLVARGTGQEYSRTDFLRWSALLGICFGLGMLTKTTTLILGAVAVGAIISIWWRTNQDNRDSVVLPLATFGAAALLICGWWLVRNQMLYGDPLAVGVFQRAFSQSSRGPSWFFQRGISSFIYLEMVTLFLFCSAWGILGGPNTAQNDLARAMVAGVPANRPDMLFAIGFLAICALACTLAFLGLMSRKILLSLNGNARAGVLLWLSGFALVALAWAVFNISYFQVQARYFHPALLPMCLFFAIGWRQLLGNGRVLRAVSIVFAVTLASLTLWNAFVWKTLV